MRCVVALWRGLLDLVAPGAVPVRGIIVPRYRDTAYPENSSKLYSKAIRQLNVGRAIAMAIAGRVRVRVAGTTAHVTVDPRPGSRRAGGAKIPNCNKHIPSRNHHTVSLRGPTCNHHFCARSELRPSTVLCCGAGPCRSRWVQPRPDPARLVSPLYSSAPHEPARRPSHASLLGAHRAHPRSRRVKEL